MKVDRSELIGSLFPFAIALAFSIFLGSTTNLGLIEAVMGVFSAVFAVGFFANLYFHMKDPDDYFWAGVFRCTYATILFLAFWGGIAFIASFLIDA